LSPWLASASKPSGAVVAFVDDRQFHLNVTVKHRRFLLSVTNQKYKACDNATQPDCCRTVQGEPFGEESDKAKCDPWEH
jgi:hypothetical protein